MKRSKRSKRVRLILLGGLSAGMLTGCGPSRPPTVSAENVYTNNYYLPGVGYYHAPFRQWYKFPYNHYDPATKSYFCGGQWSLTPLYNITNISSPTQNAARNAEMARTDVVRGGFGGYSGYHGGYGYHSWS